MNVKAGAAPPFTGGRTRTSRRGTAGGRTGAASLEPDSGPRQLAEGDRLLVDTARRVPATGEQFVLFDGDGLVVKLVERTTGARGEPALQLKSSNPDYLDYLVTAADVHIAGKVLWVLRKV